MAISRAEEFFLAEWTRLNDIGIGNCAAVPGHLIPDYPMALHIGWRGIRDRARAVGPERDRRRLAAEAGGHDPQVVRAGGQAVDGEAALRVGVGLGDHGAGGDDEDPRRGHGRAVRIGDRALKGRRARHGGDEHDREQEEGNLEAEGMDHGNSLSACDAPNSVRPCGRSGAKDGPGDPIS